MKKLIFANCILGLALLFSFCSKPDLKQELNTVTPNITASDRACTLSVTTSSNNTVQVCGTSTNAVNCKSCTGAIVQGVEFFNGNFNLALANPIIVSVIASGGANQLTLTAGGNSVGPVAFTSGQCIRFAIDNNCDVIQL